jgi:hypothetical protein
MARLSSTTAGPHHLYVLFRHIMAVSPEVRIRAGRSASTSELALVEPMKMAWQPIGPQR